MEKLLETILEIKSAQGITDRQFQKDLGLYATVISEWKNGSSKSYFKHLPKIAERLNVSVDFLLGNKDIKKEAPTEKWELSSDEQFIINVYRSLSAGEQSNFKWLAECASKNQQTTEQERNRQLTALEIQKHYMERQYSQKQHPEDDQE